MMCYWNSDCQGKANIHGENSASVPLRITNKLIDGLND
jgi:hypothetical protein